MVNNPCSDLKRACFSPWVVLFQHTHIFHRLDLHPTGALWATSHTGGDRLRIRGGWGHVMMDKTEYRYKISHVSVSLRNKLALTIGNLENFNSALYERKNTFLPWWKGLPADGILGENTGKWKWEQDGKCERIRSTGSSKEKWKTEVKCNECKKGLRDMDMPLEWAKNGMVGDIYVG